MFPACDRVLVNHPGDIWQNTYTALRSAFFSTSIIRTGAWGSVVVKALRYYSDGPGIDPRWCHLGFFPWFRALRSSQPLKMSTRDFSWGKGDRCIWLMTYHPCSAESREDPGP